MSWWINTTRPREGFDVRDKLLALRIDAWVAREVNFKRTGNKRKPEPITEPLWAPYILYETLDDMDLYLAHKIEGLGRHPKRVSDDYARTVLKPIRNKLEGDYAARMAAWHAGERVAEYEKGDSLRILTGPLAGQLAQFERVIDGARDIDVRLVASLGAVLGKSLEIRLDPLHVEKVEAA